ncbi:MAG TPA: hypothetical protein PLJ26_06485 [Candidatus Omnitrophota bacterium]|nr:hypothetical protein [Candidatus Omnitrophota bacterium]
MRLTGSKGITLIEITVVVAIIMIMSASVIVSFSQVDRRSLDTEARRLISDVYLAKKMAMNTHEGYYIIFDQANRTYRLFNSTAFLHKLVKLRSNIIVSGNNLSIHSPRGNTSGISTITLRLSGRQRNIEVHNASGYLDLN